MTNDSGPGGVMFRQATRGYDQTPVDQAVRAAEQAARSDDVSIREAAARALRETEFPVATRGYDRAEVDAYVEHLVAEKLLADPVTRAADAAVQGSFTLTFRGYDPEQVDALLRQVGQAMVTRDADQLVAARAAVQARDLRVRWFRGYDRAQVDHFLSLLDGRLESTVPGE